MCPAHGDCPRPRSKLSGGDSGRLLCDKSTIAAMLERAGVEPRHLPAALEKADRLWQDSSLNRYGTKL